MEQEVMEEAIRSLALAVSTNQKAIIKIAEILGKDKLDTEDFDEDVL